jgi:hypothetical protein
MTTTIVPDYAVKQFPRVELLASLPMTFGQMPAIALMHPAVRDPSLARVGAFPMTRYPLMSLTAPSPVAAEPDIADRGWWTVFLDPGWGRSRVHHGAHVISMRGWGRDDASTEQGS